MGRLIIWNIVSVDGCFEGAHSWDLRLHEHIWGEDLRDLSLQICEEAGLLVFGRVTYEGMAAHWPEDTSEPAVASHMNETPKLVASRTITHPRWHNTEVTADPVHDIADRKQRDERPIYVFGSATLTDTLLRANLVDEIMLGVAPVLLGTGAPLFTSGADTRPLELLESRTLDTGGVLIRYAAAHR